MFEDLCLVGGDELGGCGSGLSDCLNVLYLPAAVGSSLVFSPITESLTGDISLHPRL